MKLHASTRAGSFRLLNGVQKMNWLVAMLHDNAHLVSLVSMFRFDILISLQCSTVYCRYCNLEIPLSRRRKQLDDSLCLYLFYRDLADEAAWVRAREPIASSADLGQNLLGVQKLSKKHTVGWALSSSCSLLCVCSRIRQLCVCKLFLLWVGGRGEAGHKCVAMSFIRF